MLNTFLLAFCKKKKKKYTSEPSIQVEAAVKVRRSRESYCFICGPKRKIKGIRDFPVNMVLCFFLLSSFSLLLVLSCCLYDRSSYMLCQTKLYTVMRACVCVCAENATERTQRKRTEEQPHPHTQKKRRTHTQKKKTLFPAANTHTHKHTHIYIYIYIYIYYVV